jgi:hypothetical protein
VNDKGQGKTQFIRPAPIEINLREELPWIVANLSRARLEELVRSLREGYFWKWPIGVERGAELANLIESTAPELAKQVRSLKTPEEVRDWISIWLALLQVILGVLDHQQIVINIQQNETINITIPSPPPPAVQPTTEGPNK